MSTWILPVSVNPEKDYYEIDRALETLETIFWPQSKQMTNIEIGDIVYIYETKPVEVIGWKCRVIAVKATYEDTKTIDESPFAHGNDYYVQKDFYIKITTICKYFGESRRRLSSEELYKNGLKGIIQGAFRPNAKLLAYINSVV